MLSRVKLIAEPWDIGPGGYQLGNHPLAVFRMERSVPRHACGATGAAIPASGPKWPSACRARPYIFAGRAGRPASINYVASHDGATLTDLVTYEGKYNEANGEDNRDGIADNLACHWGVEGPSDDARIVDLRERVKRSMLMSPVRLARRTRCCWPATNSAARSRATTTPIARTTDILARLVAGRGRTGRVAHGVSPRGSPNCAAIKPQLRAALFAAGEDVGAGLKDVEWLDERDVVLSDEDWANAEGRALVMRRAWRRDDGMIDVVALLMNASDKPIEFLLPRQWRWDVLLDSADPARPRGPLGDGHYLLRDRACAVLTTVLDAAPP